MTIDELELKLRKALRGRTLLCEVPFEERLCTSIAIVFNKVITAKGLDPGRRHIVSNWPVTFACWLANEAFFNFAGAKYWPFVLEKVGIDNVNAYSSRFGQDFLQVLDDFKLPRFRRLKTRWSYLGPILAHSGIPRSCLPVFFEKVLPKALEHGVNSKEGLEHLQDDLSRLYLPRAVEWFVRFGDAVAEDFVRRSADLYRSRQQGDTDGSVAHLVPPRVAVAFNHWWSSERRDPIGPTGTRYRRPTLTFDPQDGMRLTLSAQPWEPGQAGLHWRVQVDTGTPSDLSASRLPGESHTQPQDVVFTQPFGTVTVRLLQNGKDLGFWAFAGATQQSPVLFFDPSTWRILSRASLDASLLGMLRPLHARVTGTRDGKSVDIPCVSDLGQLRFGWSGFAAAVLDLSSCDELAVVSPTGARLFSSELRELDALPPRLVPAEGSTSIARDGTQMFEGRAPYLEIHRTPGTTLREFVGIWSLRLDPAPGVSGGLPPRTVSLAQAGLQIDSLDSPPRIRVDLNQEQLLGNSPYGSFELTAIGHMGRGASFQCGVRPRVAVAHDWTEWRQGDAVSVTLGVPAGVRVLGAESTDDPRTFVLRTTEDTVHLSLVTEGYGSREWVLPFDLRVPVPSWAVFDPTQGSHLVDWSRAAVRVSLAELESKTPSLLVRGATPWGVPRSGTLTLRGPAGDVVRGQAQFDEHGSGLIDLAPFLASARQQQSIRLDLDLSLDLPRRRLTLRVAQLERDWRPDDLTVSIEQDLVAVSWEERFPVDGRTLAVLDLLQPWKPPGLLTVPVGPPRFTASVRELFPAAGVYRLSIGLTDAWTGTFTDRASQDVSFGTPGDWRARPEAADSDVDGALFRLLLSSHAPYERDKDYGDDAGHVLAPEAADKILRACLSLGATHREDKVYQRLSRVLAKVPLAGILGALARLVPAISPDVILKLRIFTRPTLIDGGRVEDEALEALWRTWGALGAWAELRCLRGRDAGAEDRLVRRLGAGTLRDLCPVAPGSRLRLFGVLPEGPVKCRITAVVAGEEVNPFSMRRIDSPTVVYVEALEPGPPARFTLSKACDGHWMLQPLDGVPLPEPFASIAAGEPLPLGVATYYPRRPAECRSAPELQVVALVRAGAASVLRQQLDACSPLPSGPVGGDAFMVAGFDWATRAASDAATLHRLTGLCASTAVPLAREALRRVEDEGPGFQEGSKRVTAELVARWHDHVEFEPLLAVHLLSWITAMSLVWRGIARPLPFIWPEARVNETALALLACAPKLLEHDIAKICAIEALVVARGDNGSGPTPDADPELVQDQEGV